MHHNQWGRVFLQLWSLPLTNDHQERLHDAPASTYFWLLYPCTLAYYIAMEINNKEARMRLSLPLSNLQTGLERVHCPPAGRDVETEAGHQVSEGINFWSRAGAWEDAVSLVEDAEEGRHDFHGDVRKDDGRLLGSHSQGSAHQEGTQRQQEGFVNLNSNRTLLDSSFT